MRIVLLAMALSTCAFAASPATCYPATGVTSITTLAQWNNAANWSSSSHGTASTCGASGGAGKAIWGVTTTLNAGVPGAYTISAAACDVGSYCDSIVVPVDSTIHVPAGIGIVLGNPSNTHCSVSGNTICDGFQIHATNSSTYGSLIIDEGASLLLHGYSGAGYNFGIIDQYAVLSVQPNGYLWFGTANNTPLLSVGGRVYVGWGDQSLYPMPSSTGASNAGTWVTASVASTLNFAAVSSMPSISPNDLVELDAVQQQSGAYPYTAYDGVTPPPTPPIMPSTTDTATCGSGTCYVPESTLLCVVAVSGNTVSLGWPSGGNSFLPYCTGSETAIGITAAGSGQLWLKKPAIFGGDPSGYTWNNSKSGSFSSQSSNFDGVRSGLVLCPASGCTGSPFGQISNAAGTGPGRIGDNSLTMSWTAPSSMSGITSCSKLNVNAVQSSGDCYIDYGNAVLYAQGYSDSFSGSYSYKTISTPTTLSGNVAIPSGTRSYNELVFANADIQNLYAPTSSSVSFVLLSNLPNTANNHMGVWHITSRNSNGEFELSGDTNTSAANPIQFVQSAWMASPIEYIGNAHINFNSSTNYVDVSGNRNRDRHALLGCMNTSANPNTSTLQNFYAVTVTNNVDIGDQLFAPDNYRTCNWRNLLYQQNRVQGTGTGGITWLGYVFAFGGVHNYDNTPQYQNLLRGNYEYGTYRSYLLPGNVRLTQDYSAWNWHHVIVMTDNTDGQAITGWAPNVQIDHSILASQINSNVPCIDSGYNDYTLVDNLTVLNNTCVGFNGTNGSGGFMWGDTDPGATLLANANVSNNAFGLSASGYAMQKTQYGTGGMTQQQMSTTVYNGMQSGTTPYQGISPNPNTIPNPSYNRSVSATWSGVNYNTAATRGITGIAVQNAAGGASTTIALKYTYTSSTNITLQESTNGGSSYGTAVQLNWGGSGTSYTLSSVTDPGALFSYQSVLTTGTPFTTFCYGSSVVSCTAGSSMPTGCPIARWATMLTGGNAGQSFGIINCFGSTYNTATNNLTFVPRPSGGLASSGTFAIISAEVNVCDQSAANCIDIGIDARNLPTSTQTDTGIVVVASDYCATQCVSASNISGLPSTFTAGTTNSPLVPVAMPEQGGSSEQAHCNGQATCGGTSYYVPSGTGWYTSILNNGYVGAVSPNPANLYYVP